MFCAPPIDVDQLSVSPELTYKGFQVRTNLQTRDQLFPVTSTLAVLPFAVSKTHRLLLSGSGVTSPNRRIGRIHLLYICKVIREIIQTMEILMFSLIGWRQYSNDLLQTHNEVYTCFSLFNKRESLKEHMWSVSKGQSCDDEQRTERVTHSFFDNFLTDLSQYYCHDTVRSGVSPSQEYSCIQQRLHHEIIWILSRGRPFSNTDMII